jgi:CTP:molybdopterin cytidylyltransferase MocA
MLHAVIMAGGAGTRFWPASTAARPKQLLPLAGERSMIQATVDRLAGLVAADDVLIVTNEKLVESIRHQLPELPSDAILGEPAKRDTAPCIGLAAIQLAHRDPDATMAVMPSDHVIQPVEVFQESIRLAARLVDENPTRIVTFGIPPTYPAEIFGYIERGEAVEPVSGPARTTASSGNTVSYREPPGALKIELKATSAFSHQSGRSGDLPHVFLRDRIVMVGRDFGRFAAHGNFACLAPQHGDQADAAAIAGRRLLLQQPQQPRFFAEKNPMQRAIKRRRRNF